MAIDYGRYVELQGAGTDLTPLQQGITQAISNSKDNLTRQVNQASNEFWNTAMKPFEDAIYGEASNIGTLGLGMMNAGQAFADYKAKLNTLGPRAQRVAAEQGMLNPIQFKQQYDQLKSSYMPMIEKKLETHFQINNLTDSEKRKFITGSNLNSFLLMNASDGGLIKELANPERTWAQWREQQGGALGLGAKAAGVGFAGVHGAATGKRLYRQWGDTTPDGLPPNQRGRLARRLGIPSGRQALRQGFQKAGQISDVGLDVEDIRKDRTRIAQDHVNTKADRTRAQTAMDKAKKKWTKAGNSLKGKGAAEFNKKHKSLVERLNKADDAFKVARNQKPKNITKLLSSSIQKHGKAKVARAIMKKLGVRGGISLLAKLGLMAVPTGVSQAVSVGLLAADVVMVYQVLKSLNK